jgi:hypothetical protein
LGAHRASLTHDLISGVLLPYFRFRQWPKRTQERAGEIRGSLARFIPVVERSRRSYVVPGRWCWLSPSMLVPSNAGLNPCRAATLTRRSLVAARSKRSPLHRSKAVRQAALIPSAWAASGRAFLSELRNAGPDLDPVISGDGPFLPPASAINQEICPPSFGTSSRCSFDFCGLA